MAKEKIGDIVDKGEGRYLLKNVRLSFPFLFKPDEQTNDAGQLTRSFRTALLLPKKTHRPVAVKLNSIIKALVASEYDGKTQLGSDRLFFRDGDKSDMEDHHGHWVVSVRESRRPTLVDRDRRPTTEDDELLFAGAWVNVVIRPWAQNGKSMKKKNKYGKRICCGFDIVQFVDKDESLAGGARPDVDEILDELEDDDFQEDGDDDDDDDIGL